MRTKSLMSTLALAAGLAAGGAFLVPAIAQPATDNPLNIAQIYDKLTAAGYTQIDEIERENGSYEVKATDADGRRVELDVDAATANVMKTEVKRDRRRDERR